MPRLSEGAQPENQLTTFTRFGSLPLELRLIIWKMAAAVPRIIELDLDTNNLKRRGHHMFNGRKREQVQPLLCVNRESRAVSLEDDYIYFTHYGYRGVVRHFAITERDILFVNGTESQTWQLRLSGETRLIRQLMIPQHIEKLGCMKDWSSAFGFLVWDATRIFKNRDNLEKLYCLMLDGDQEPPHVQIDDLQPFTAERFPQYAEAFK
ncbi:Uu.00g006330.m01.CDS01 [Anthostomella pinea]|uniref:Uu.00g006330.m01.CDS01 n=1 Tax=Anthostomella pinea TaxID=933095 RepID=A0AAI8VEY9_9PEZI|nr:Uu.00g006330.m01.CDS01 [Anthostomella pinea]